MTRPRSTLLAAGLSLLVLAAGHAAANDNLWTNSTNNFTWDTTSTNWAAPFVWNNANVDDAAFGSSGAGAITLAAPITLRGMLFTAGGYSITGSGANVLTLTNGGSSQSGIGVGEIQVASGVTDIINATLAGNVGLTKTGTGSLYLYGTNNYSGTTSVNSGMLQIGNGGAAPAGIANGAVSIASTLRYFYDTTSDLSVASTFTGGGSLQFYGIIASDHSSYTLTGNNSGFTGVIFVGGASNPARVIAHNGGQLSPAAIQVASGSGIYLPGGTYNNNFYINGFGWAESSGQLGALRVENGATITGPVTLQSNARITTFFGSGGSITGPISGAFTLEKTGTYTLALAGNNTYGGTLISAGTLQVGTGGTAGTLPGNTTDNGVLSFNRSDTYTYGGVISGSGSVTQFGTGTTILTGANTYTGGTTISAGTLQVGNGGNAGALPGNVVNNGALVFNTTAFSTYGGVVSGSGSLTVAGSSTLVLTNSGNSYTGGTFVTGGGTLILTGACNALPNGGNVTVGAGSYFDLSSPSSNTNFSTPIGTITLNGGTLTSFGGSGSNAYNAANLIMTGGTVDFSTAGFFGLNLTGNITTYGSSTTAKWIGSASNPFIFASGIPTQTINVAAGTTPNGIDLDSSIKLSGDWTMMGPGVTRLTAGAFGSLVLTVSGGTLRLDDVAVLNSLTVTPGQGNYLSLGATLEYGGPTATSAAYPLYLSSSASTIKVDGAVSLTLGNLLYNFLSAAGSLNKTGPGTLVLTNAGNSYTGGTFVNAGVLQLPSGTAVNQIPSGGNVTVAGGAVFGIGASSGSSNIGSPVGTITLNGGSMLIGPTGATVAQYFAGSLVMSGGAVDMSAVGSGGGALYFTGGVTTNASSTTAEWYGSSSSATNIISNGGVTLPITVAAGTTASGIDLDSSINLGGNWIKNGPGVLRLTQQSSTLGLTVTAGKLRVDNVAILNFLTNPNPLTGTFLTLNGGTLQYGGPTAATTAANLLTLGGSGGTIEVMNTQALILADAISGGGGLTKTGPGTLVLSNVGNSFIGGPTVTQGMLSVAADAMLGSSVMPVNVGPLGTLLYASSGSTSRTIIMNSGNLQAAPGTTLTLTGATVGGGFLSGTFAVTGATTLSGVTTPNSTTINQTGSASYTNFTNGGALNLAASASSFGLVTAFVNQGSGAITLAANSVMYAADFQSYGLLTIANGTGGANTLLRNSGTGPLYFNGGSRTFVGTIGGNGDAQLELNGQNAIVAGGLFVNNGHVTDSSGPGVSTIIADYGALVKGGGQYDNSPITRNGGKFQAGNSPGVATMGRFVFGPGGVSNYILAIDDATGQAGPTPDALGHVSGWGLIKAATWQRAVGATSGDFVFNADPNHPLSVAIDTLVNPTTVGIDVPGLMADFDPSRSYSWPVVQWTGTYSGPTDVASLDAATNFDTNGFANPIAGAFGWSLDPAANSLSLTYTPSAVPEPGTLALVGLAGLGLRCLRRAAVVRKNH